MSAFRHFKTITKHRFIVMKYCFRAGLYRQGLIHDLSKYSPTEFFTGARYYQGDKSPNVAERHDIGYSLSWIHHKGRNKHHFEYWLDSNRDGYVPVDMPKRYVAEMLFDRIAACKTYNGHDYSDGDPLKYYKRGCDCRLMHDNTKKNIESLLTKLADEGEKAAIAYIKNVFLKNE